MEVKDEEDFFVVVVEDQNENCDQNKGFPFPLEIKQEIPDENDPLGIDLLIENATKHGEVLYSMDFDIKEEPLDEVEEEPEEIISSDLDLIMKRRRNKLRIKRESLVSDLKKQFPDVSGNSNKTNAIKLIETLAELMRRVVTPTPPRDFFIMNGIDFECCTCGEIKDAYPVIERHYQEKHGPRYLVCYGCGADFRSRTNLYKHEKQCNAPDMKYVLKARAIYLGRKARNRPYIQQTKFQAYANTEEMLACTMCSAVFKTALSLHAHVLMHNGQRPFKCPDCDAAYTSNCTLARHRRKHNLLQYICDHCERVFKTRETLIAHLDTHLPEKKFGCPECPKRYAQKSAMLLHVDRVHRHLPPPFACKICSRRFRRMSLLKEHMKKSHGMEVMTRKMFFKMLPKLTENQLQQAKIVMKSDMKVPVKQTDYCILSMDSEHLDINQETDVVENVDD